MNTEKDFLNKKVKNELGNEWEICSNDDNDPNYEYEEIEVSQLQTKEYTIEALNKFIQNDIKTNIHMIYSKVTHEICMDIVNGKDVWNGQLDLNKLNAVIFLLFKPHGAGKTLDWKPTVDQLKEFSNIVFNSQASFKIGMDSCLINHMIKYGNPTKLQLTTIDTCEAARMSAYITPTMRFMPCSFANEVRWSLPLKDSCITEIWNNGDNFISFRNDLSNNRDKCPLEL